MTEKLKEEHLKDLQSTFNLFAKSGIITLVELGTILRMLALNPTEAELTEMISEIDTSGKGSIDFKEFLNLMTRKFEATNIDEELRNAFRVFDKDNDGLISTQELKTVMESQGEKLTEDEIAEMIKEADIDGDGKINFDELTKVMNSK